MKKNYGIGLVALLVCVACSSDACEGFDGVRPPSWTQHPDLVAPGGTLCRADANSAVLDYPHESNPFVVIVDHLEAQGWERTTQNIDDPQLMNVMLRKEAGTVSVTITDEDGDYDRVMMRATH
jgi:hypothetical protein